jgi:hypothetical protein
MARWTDWRQIASGNSWSDADLDWDGPACYELALGGPRGGGLQQVYVGETSNERARISSYAYCGSHLRREINLALRRGWTLFYRARAMRSKAEAVLAQDALLAQYDYDWNIAGNTWGKQ